ncbi:translation initiation factor IF-2 N-terminal domain-containing protein [Lactococcus garvieae]
MKLYKLAEDLGVNKKALLSFAQKQGIEAKTLARELTEDEVEILIAEFEEQGGLGLSPKGQEFITQEGSFTLPEDKKKMSLLSQLKNNFKGYEKVPKEPEVMEARTVKAKRAKLIYKLFCLLVILFFVGLGNAAYQANVQVKKLTNEINQTTQVLNTNQKQLEGQNKKLEVRLNKLETKEKVSEATKKQLRIKNNLKNKNACKG